MRSWRSTAAFLAVVAGLLALSMSLAPVVGCGGGTPGSGPSGTNTPPMISSLVVDPPSVKVGGTSMVTAEASDADGDTLTYSWSATGGSISGSEATVSWKAPSSAGTYTVMCSVSDEYGGTGSEAANLTVTPNTGGFDITIQ
jgi:hypothetical protein